MKNLLFFAACLLALSACQTKTTKPAVDSTAAYSVPDDKAITRAVTNTYAALSFNKGEQPKYDAIKNCFIDKAESYCRIGDSVMTINLGQFIYLDRSYIESAHIQYMRQEQLYGKAEQFGNVAQYRSTYKVYMNNPDSAAERGVNFFQLVKTTSGWKVSSITWDIERPGLKVPGYYGGK